MAVVSPNCLQEILRPILAPTRSLKNGIPVPAFLQDLKIFGTGFDFYVGHISY